MKKSKFLVAACALPLLLASCGVDKGIVIWSPFGSTYSGAIKDLIDAVQEETGYHMTHESQGNYKAIYTNIKNSISNGSYPHIGLGYPDHFADYAMNRILMDLTPLIEKYDAAHNTKLVDDYYPDYMKENMEIQEGKIYGLPFNKSTEVMVYNVELFEFLKTKDNSITKVPETWEELRTDGVKMLKVLHDENVFGKQIFLKDGAYTVANKGSGPAGANIIADYSECKEASFTLFSYDSMDNMFITMLHQFGGEYTVYTDEEKASRAHRGHIEFWVEGEHRNKTIEAMRCLYDLYTVSPYDSKVFYRPTGLYNSGQFKLGQVLFNVCSSGGLSNNIPTTTKFTVGIAPIPYKDADHKYVISQGTNLGLFDKDMSDEELMQCMEIMVKLSTGEIQGAWASTTGYFPSSISATESSYYQDLINKEQTNESKKVYKASATVNQNEYMGEGKNWIKFTDPAFAGSAAIRAKIEVVIQAIIEKHTKISPTFTFEDAVKEVMDSIKSDLQDYWRE